MPTCIYGYITSGSYAAPKRRPKHAIPAPAPKVQDIPGPPHPTGSPAPANVRRAHTR